VSGRGLRQGDTRHGNMTIGAVEGDEQKKRGQVTVQRQTEYPRDWLSFLSRRLQVGRLAIFDTLHVLSSFTRGRRNAHESPAIHAKTGGMPVYNT